MYRTICNRKRHVKTPPTTFPIHMACLSGNLPEIKKYISSGGNIDCRERNGRTPLHEACCVTEFSNFVKSGTVLGLVKLLILHGADPLATDDFGETPLHCVARHRKNREVASFLVIECKASLSWLNKFGQTPLDVAKESSTSLLETLKFQNKPTTINSHYLSSLPEVLQFLLLQENLSNRSLRNLVRDRIIVCLLPFSNEKLDQLPLPEHLKCYVGGVSFIQWMKQRELLLRDYNSNNEEITQSSSCKLM